MNINKCNEFWPNFESFIGQTIPSDIKEFLVVGGYTNELALKEIESDDVTDMESRIGKCLLPGHKKFIIALGKKAKEYDSVKSAALNCEDKFEFDGTFILKELVETARKNKKVHSTRYRYSDSVQWFATYLFLLGGRATYEFVSSNLPLPSVSTIREYIVSSKMSLFSDFLLILAYLVSYIQKRKEKIVEGELRCKELSEYLNKIGAPKEVWINEDGSGIVSHVAYDQTTNQLVGLALPLDKNGMPVPFSFTPNSVGEINDQMKHNARSTLVYLILAQPIQSNAAPFILQVFGTNNKFKSNDVLQRWTHIRDQLARLKITFISILTTFRFI